MEYNKQFQLAMPCILVSTFFRLGDWFHDEHSWENNTEFSTENTSKFIIPSL